MRRHVLTIVLLAAVLAGVPAFSRVQREQEYQRLILEGDRALARDDLSAAVEAFSGAVTLKPDAMLAYLRRGEAYRRRGMTDLSSAYRDLRTAASLDPAAPAPEEGLGDVALSRDNAQRAVEHYKAALALDERSARVEYKLGLALYRTGQIDAALHELTLAGQLDARLAQVPYVKALCLTQTGRYAEARTALAQALTLDARLTPAREALAEVVRAQHDFNEEQTQLAMLARAEPDKPERQLALGRAYARAGRTDLAVTTLSAAAERFPSEPVFFTALARVWLDQAVATGDRIALQKGLEASREAGPLAASDSGLLTLTGSAWLRVREPRRALRSFEQATAVAPIDPLAYPKLAETAERLGLWTVARDALRHAHALGDPADSATARARLIRLGDLSMKIGDFASARDWFTRARTNPGPDALVAARLAGANQAIDKEAPLDDEPGSGTSSTGPRR